MKWHHKTKHPPNAEEGASCCSSLFFNYVHKLLSVGTQKPLDFSDLPELYKDDDCWHMYQKFAAAWKSEVECAGVRKRTPSVMWALLKISPLYYVAVTFSFVFSIMSACGPLNLKYVVMYVNDPSEWTIYEGLAFALCLFIPTVMASYFMQHSDHIMNRVALRARGALTIAIYKKSLRLSNKALLTYSAGNISNLISTDAQRLADFSFFLNWMYNSPIIIIISIAILGDEVGVSVLPAVGIMMVILLLSFRLSSVVVAMEHSRNAHCDGRLVAMDEAVQGMLIIKLFAWEKAFIKKITRLREKELADLLRIFYTKATTQVLGICIDYLVAAIIFYLYVNVHGNTLSPAKAFTILGLIYGLRVPFLVTVVLVPSLSQLLVSFRRISSFLDAEERDTGYVVAMDINDHVNDVSIKKGTFSWCVGENPVLHSIELHVPKHALVSVAGPVGCGKSALFQAILGNLTPKNDNASVGVASTRIAYVAQVPWIMNCSVKDNILISSPPKDNGIIDEVRYEKCIDMCGLRADLTQLPAGDLTEIGERGTNLSGGQKQRIALARALYSDADIYLLDDPLSASDIKVANFIFRNGVLNFLKNRTCIMITHHLDFLGSCDMVINMKDGRIISVDKHMHEKTLNIDESVTQTPVNVTKIQNGKSRTKKDVPLLEISLRNSVLHPETIKIVIDDHDDKKIEKVVEDEETVGLIQKHTLERNNTAVGGLLVEDELRLTGRVKMSIFTTYIGSGLFSAVASGIFFLSLFLLEGGVRIITDGWLSAWSSKQYNFSAEFYVKIYLVLILAFVVMVALRAFSIALQLARISKSLHERLLARVMHAPMAFFETTPYGRLLTRFSRDISVVDLLLPQNVIDTYHSFLQLFLAIVVACIASPFVLILFSALVLVYYRIQKLYRANARELQRLESIHRSPVVSLVTETLNDVVSVNSFDLVPYFQTSMVQKLDNNSITLYAQRVVERWLAVRLESIGGLIAVITGLATVIAAYVGKDTRTESERAWVAGVTGIALAYSLSLPGFLNWLVRQASELEIRMNSVERICEYSDMPVESAAIVKDNRPGLKWPLHGDIQVNNLSIRYRPNLPLAIDNISFAVKRGQKVGVVGRTGSGKTTLLNTIFRILEIPEDCIHIDDIDIRKIGLNDLRRKITIIPQTPLLFYGTIRSNIDPFGLATDFEIIDALKQSQIYNALVGRTNVVHKHATMVHDKYETNNVHDTLERDEDLGSQHNSRSSQVMEIKSSDIVYDVDILKNVVERNGTNFSLGQRQLLCLARAMLRKPRVLVLDEATASVDSHTDSIIQKTVREAFKHSTVITIAHRLNTIVDSDCIIVMRDGKIAEMGDPKQLQSKKDSIFLSMMESDVGHTVTV